MHFDLEIFGLTEGHRSRLVMILGKAEEKRSKLFEREGEFLERPKQGLEASRRSPPNRGQDKICLNDFGPISNFMDKRNYRNKKCLSVNVEIGRRRFSGIAGRPAKEI